MLRCKYYKRRGPRKGSGVVHLIPHRVDIDQRPAENDTRATFGHWEGDTVHTITFDNGSEFSDHVRIARKLVCDIYFAKLYHAWQRGTNENLNGELRRHYPKGVPLKYLHRDELTEVEDATNTRYRKILDYQTAAARYEHERARQLD